MIASILEAGQYVNGLTAGNLARAQSGYLALMDELATLDGESYWYIYGGDGTYPYATSSLGGDINHRISSTSADILGNLNGGNHLLRSAGLKME